jgi:hypothetical protein
MVPPEKLLPGGERATIATLKLLAGARPASEYLWVRAAEDFVALRHSTFISQVLQHLRATLWVMMIVSFMIVFSMTVYPFRPFPFVAAAGWSLVVAVVVAALYRVIQLERNEVLSRLGGTEPNKIQWNANFVHQIVLYGVIPLTAALVGLFPDLGNWLTSILTPLARMFTVSN